MNADFALSLSYEGIRLLHRVADAWQCVGDVQLSVEDMDASMRVMRKTASALHPGGFRSKLIIPNDQIRYLTLDTGDLSAPERRLAAEAALAGATPYAIGDLVIDVVANGTRTYVAAVARETLQEAEAFAVGHGFNPISYVAVPELGSYSGEPFFGPTAHALRTLPADEVIERDTHSIVLLGHRPRAEDVSGTDTDDLSKESPNVLADVVALDDAAVEPDASTTEALGDAALDDVDEVTSETVADVPVVSFSSRRAATPAEGPKLGGVTRSDTPPLEDEQTPVFAHHAHAEPVETVAHGERADTTPENTDLAAIAPTSNDLARPAPVAERAIVPDLDEAERLTVFGARGTTVEPVDKPRALGIALSAVLLLLLLGVAAWTTVVSDTHLASLFRDGPEPTAEAPAISLPEAVVPEITGTAKADPVEDATAPTELAALDPTLTEEDTAVLDALTDPLPKPEETPPLTEAEIEARYAVTGIWATTPAAPTPAAMVALDDVYQTSIDPTNQTGDAVALVQPDPPGAEIGPFSSPAGPEIRYTLDARGMVVPTRQGAMNPDGILIYAGKPPTLPPERPKRIRPAEGAEVQAVNPAIAKIRPQARPVNLIEDNERATLGGLSRIELAAYRPVMRPPVSRTPQERQIEDAIEEALENALAASVRPQTRSRNFERVVARATPTARPAAARVTPRTVTPNIPTAASVSRQATLEDAINLRRINLIGVFGTPSERRALVRMPNGRYKKVRVGDNLDGGRVSAIGDSELRYQKSGRNLVLKMPQG